MVERKALEMNDEERIAYLTKYADSLGNLVHRKWVELGNYLVTKYNDGYVKDSSGRIRPVSYPEEWMQYIIRREPKKHLTSE